MIYTGYIDSAIFKSLMGGVIDVANVNGPAPSGSTAEQELFQISFCLPGIQLCNFVVGRFLEAIIVHLRFLYIATGILYHLYIKI